jgi:hypothetical protein
MSIENRVFVRMPSKLSADVLNLAARAAAALARAEKLPPGDRTEAVRFESLHAAIDQLAISALANGAPHEVLPESAGDDLSGPSIFGPGPASLKAVNCSVPQWIQEGSVVVELRLPHFPGTTLLAGESGIGPPKPAARWTSSEGRAGDAVQKRFEYLLDQAVERGVDGRAAVCPSNIANRVLTEGLRRYTHRTQGQARVDAPVLYRDGSKGRPFPLRALSLTESVPEGMRTLRFALMSIRHVDMDNVVDGAWLRNVKISRSRAAGFTDEIVFETSLRQLRRLAADAPTLIHMYQTGLDTAIVGFYRAVVHQLLDKCGSICVVPYYYQEIGNQFSEGTAWTTI